MEFQRLFRKFLSILKSLVRCPFCPAVCINWHHSTLKRVFLDNELSSNPRICEKIAVSWNHDETAVLTPRLCWWPVLSGQQGPFRQDLRRLGASLDGLEEKLGISICGKPRNRHDESFQKSPEMDCISHPQMLLYYLFFWLPTLIKDETGWLRWSFWGHHPQCLLWHSAVLPLYYILLLYTSLCPKRSTSML